MTFDRICAIYFSPTGGTRGIVRLLAESLRAALESPPDAEALPYEEFDFTSPAARERDYRFGAGDLVVLGSPVYAGRLPNKIMPDWKKCLSAEGAAAVPVAVFGNRNFDGALTEFRVILQDAGFRLVAGAALVSRHAFSDAVGAGRPDDEDREEIRAFAERIARKLRDLPEGSAGGLLPFTAEEEIPPYYTPLKEDGTPAKFLKAKPLTDTSKCVRCGTCRASCPMGSIDGDMQAFGVCIKCQACVRKCPGQAKYFADEDFLSHVRMLERDYRTRADNCYLI